MEKKKIISIILGVSIIVIAIIMPFHLEEICHKFSMHPEWSLGTWGAVRVYSTFYSIAICVLTLILVLLNAIKKTK